MGFWSFVGHLFGIPTAQEALQKDQVSQGYKSATDPIAQADTGFMNYGFGAAQQNFGAATTGFQNLLNYFGNQVNGSASNLTKYFNTDEVTKNQDANEQNLATFGGRSGQNPSLMASLPFARESNLMTMVQNMRNTAANSMIGINSNIANIASEQGSLGLNAGAQAAGIAGNVAGLQTQALDRRTGLINGVISAIGGAAGLVAGLFKPTLSASTTCTSIDSLIATPSGPRRLGSMGMGSKVISPSLDGNHKVRTVTRIRFELAEVYNLLSSEDDSVLATYSHILYDENGKEVPLRNLSLDDKVIISDGKVLTFNPLVKIEKYPEPVMVGIIKLDDEEECYPYIANGFVSLDDIRNFGNEVAA